MGNDKKGLVAFYNMFYLCTTGILSSCLPVVVVSGRGEAEEVERNISKLQGAMYDYAREPQIPSDTEKMQLENRSGPQNAPTIGEV